MLTKPSHTRSGANEMVFAEFGGKVYAAVRQMMFSTAREDDELFDYKTVVRSRFTLTCDCRASAEWSRTPVDSDVTAYHHMYRQPGDLDTDVAIVRTPLDAPICEHWIGLPLKISVEDV